MQNKPAKINLRFPKHFLWGASTSAHQVEGGNHNQWTVWELENAKSRAKQSEYRLTWLPAWPEIKDRALDPNNYISGRAADHYNRFEEDFDIVKKLNMNVFKFSVEWSRVEPSEGNWDAEAIAHYKKYVVELKKRGIEPIMTLFHWSVPVWFEEKGAFKYRGNIKYFVRFAEKIVSELGMDVKHICILNEPGTYIFNSYEMGEGGWPMQVSNLQGIRIYYNLSIAHKKAAIKIKSLNKRYKIGISQSLAHIYPGDDSWLSRQAARVIEWGGNHFFLNRIKKNLDWIGVNYYHTARVLGYRIHNPEEPTNDLGWFMDPAGLEFVLEDIYDKYKIPVFVTESGLSDMDDKNRKWWISSSVLAMQRALDKGVDLRGYLHWSLLDNFEWAYGKWPRFGLIYVDYETMQRRARPSAVWFSKLIKQIRSK